MAMALQLLIFSGILGLAIGLIGFFIGSTNNQKRRLLAWQASRRLAQQPWDMDRDNRRGNR